MTGNVKTATVHMTTASEMTYNVAGGALSSTHSLTHPVSVLSIATFQPRGGTNFTIHHKVSNSLMHCQCEAKPKIIFPA